MTSFLSATRITTTQIDLLYIHQASHIYVCSRQREGFTCAAAVRDIAKAHRPPRRRAASGRDGDGDGPEPAALDGPSRLQWLMVFLKAAGCARGGGLGAIPIESVGGV